LFQINEFTEARLATLTPRSEKHGEEDVPAVSLGLELTVANTLLDVIDPEIRQTLYKAVDDQEPLPGVEVSTPVLRCNSFDRHTLPAKYEGWTLQIDDGVDDTKPMTFGSVKCDKFSVEAKQGGTVILRLRVGTSDLDAERSGFLGMHVGQPVWITLTAPEKQADVIDGTTDAFKRDHPEAGDMFAAAHSDAPDGPDDDGSDEDDEGGVDTEPDPAIMGGARSFEKAVKAELAERTSARTERGRAKTQAALKAGSTH
jgi:hypothetical protein